MVRPHDDLRDHDEVPDPQETIHFLRQSNEQWQATAERIARQRDALHTAARAYRDHVEDAAWMDDPRGGPDYDALVNALDTALGIG